MIINAKSQDGYTKIRQAFKDIHDTLRFSRKMAKFYYADIANLLDGLEDGVFVRTIEIVISSYRGYTMPKRDQWHDYISQAKKELKQASESAQLLYNGMPVNKSYYYNEQMPTEEDKEKSREILNKIKRKLAKSRSVVGSCE